MISYIKKKNCLATNFILIIKLINSLTRPIYRIIEEEKLKEIIIFLYTSPRENISHTHLLNLKHSILKFELQKV